MKRKNLLTLGLVGFMLLGIALIFQVFRDNGATSATNDGEIQLKAGQVVPEVILTTYEGGSVNLLEDRGDVTVLFAMSYWCTTCVPEAQVLARLYEEYADQGFRVVVIDLDADASNEQLQGFMDEVGENRLTWAFDTQAEFMYRYGVRALDTTIVLDEEGREVYRDIRPTSYETLRQIIEQLL